MPSDRGRPEACRVRGLTDGTTRVGDTPGDPRWRRQHEIPEAVATTQRAGPKVDAPHGEQAWRIEVGAQLRLADPLAPDLARELAVPAASTILFESGGRTRCLGRAPLIDALRLEKVPYTPIDAEEVGASDTRPIVRHDGLAVLREQRARACFEAH